MAKRFSITLSDKQAGYLEDLSERGGACPTAYVYHLVIVDINRNLNVGVIGDGKGQSSDPILLEFIRSLISDEGIDMSIVTKICQTHDISFDRMSVALGLDDEPVVDANESVVESIQPAEDVAA
jgi:hypothetical protein